MIQLKTENDLYMERLPYEILEEITKKIFPKNIDSHEIPVAFRTILNLSHTNKKMKLFVQSNRITNYINEVILENKENLNGSFSRMFLKRYILTNGLDRVFEEGREIQKTICSVLNRITRVFEESICDIQYQEQNFAHHQIQDVVQPKTYLMIFLSDSKPMSVDVLYPFGTMTIRPFGKMTQNAELSIANGLIKSLHASFRGLFEKQERKRGSLVQRTSKDDPKENLPFEFIESRYFSKPYAILASRIAPETFSIRELKNTREVESKKGNKELVFSLDPHLFSCYRIKTPFEDIFYRNKAEIEMAFLSQIFLSYFEVLSKNSRRVLLHPNKALSL